MSRGAFSPLKYQSGAVWRHKGDGPDIVIIERWWSGNFRVRPTADPISFNISEEALERDYEVSE